MTTLIDEVGCGVITGDKVIKVYEYASKNGFAIPAVNVTSSSSANAVMEAAKALNSPIIIQISNGGAAFFAGKSIPNTDQAVSVRPDKRNNKKALCERLKKLSKFFCHESFFRLPSQVR